MGKFNYNKVNKKEKPVDIPKQEEIVEEIEEIVEEPTSTVKIGKIFDCDQVYLRESDSRDSDYIDILDNGDEVLVEDVIGEWCKVTTAVGKDGFVMKQFIKID